MTRLIPATSFVIRDDILRSTSEGKTNLQLSVSHHHVMYDQTLSHQSAVMKSSDCTARSAMTCSYVRASPITPTALTGSSTAKA